MSMSDSSIVNGWAIGYITVDGVRISVGTNGTLVRARVGNLEIGNIEDYPVNALAAVSDKVRELLNEFQDIIEG